ncbi:MAG: hydroxysqualene dehydroxylase HpnE [Acidobacteriota bacterium]|nr:hydroxysqualene dehydroxylase HpnE [Blastocatellia bacterium]MDW8411802.1 hydroxysqualene dehydroxylase HpnE [Acidobacteriota bacterium]
MKDKTVAIIGGGFAGLAAAVALAETGYKVTVFERRAALGGRAYSFIESITGDVLDNGQHLLMGCYHETFKFLRKLGTAHLVNLQQRPRVDFIDVEGKQTFLECPKLPAPLHLLFGLFRLKGIPIRDKLGFLRLGNQLRIDTNRLRKQLASLTVDQWLDAYDQSKTARKRFWEMLCVATINLDPAQAAAVLLAEVLRRSFGSSYEDACLGLPATGLSQLYTEQARYYIEQRGGNVRLRTPVKKLLISSDCCLGLQTERGETFTADYYISAVPHLALKEILPAELFNQPYFAAWKNFKTSPIVSINLWFDKPITELGFVGLVQGRIQWLFNKNLLFKHCNKDKYLVSCVISAATNYSSSNKNDLVSLALEDLANFFPSVRTAKLLNAVVVKEQHATFRATVDAEASRPKHKSPVNNLFLAGDWTDTGLPATIESAVLSGHKCAQLVSAL